MAKSLNLFRTLLILTIISIFTQILFLYLNSLTNQLIDTFITSSITTEVLKSKIFLIGLIEFLAAQLLVYGVFLCLVWYVATAIGALLHLRERWTYTLGLLLWLTSVVTVVTANCYFSPNSFFSGLIQNYFLTLSNTTLKITFTSGAILLASVCVLAFIHLTQQLAQKKHLLRHGSVLTLIAVILFLQVGEKITTRPVTISTASAARPNVIIIGIDALRPDFVGFYQSEKTARTPTLDNFLSTAIEFSNATTTLARTFPSWGSILTSSYPLHNRVRGNNTNLSYINVADTVPKEFKKAGYATLYGTDDTRFNNTNEVFGFDHIISPTMGLIDLVFGSINDFPLTNLIIPTVVGKLLFPYNYANHGTAITYVPTNFLALIQSRLHQRDTSKPLFISVHFTMSHWPFYWFNDKQPLNSHMLQRYQSSITGVDAQLSAFLKILKQNKLLDHAIVILLSDHGLSLGLPAERPISVANYNGDKNNIKKIPVYHYSKDQGSSADYNIDTSYGYGGDVLSLKQYHTLLAFKGYGVDIGKPHSVTDRVSLMDIGPTLLALLKLNPLPRSDGISLTPYLFQQTPVTASQTRRFFLETTFSIDALEKEDISVSDVLQKTVQLYEVNFKSGLISIKLADEKLMNHDKQFGLVQGDWFLVKYPSFQRTRLRVSGKETIAEIYTQPSYYILINLKSGAWTTELDTPFALNSPVQSLLRDLRAFYGDELNRVEFSAKMHSKQASLSVKDGN
jgi:arylsulfatase A-like enzyme